MRRKRGREKVIHTYTLYCNLVHCLKLHDEIRNLGKLKKMNFLDQVREKKCCHAAEVIKHFTQVIDNWRGVVSLGTGKREKKMCVFTCKTTLDSCQDYNKV